VAPDGQQAERAGNKDVEQDRSMRGTVVLLPECLRSFPT